MILNVPKFLYLFKITDFFTDCANASLYSLNLTQVSI